MTAAITMATSGPAVAVQTAQTSIVSADPVGWTPHVLDGRVKAIVQTGDTIILGGSFTKVSSADGKTTYNRNNMVAFNASTGAVSTTFVPNPDGEVSSLVVAPDGTSLFVGGFFNNVAGKASKSLAKVNLSDGKLKSGFTAPALTGRVKDMRLAGGRLWIAGTFTHVAGNYAQPGLATLNATSGAFDGYNRVKFAAPYNNATMQVLKIDVSPNGQRLVAIGNFSTVDGQSRPQLAMLDLSGTSAKVANWQSDFYSTQCAAAYDTYMHDVDISPDGKYFVVTTTGAWRGNQGPCDTTSRFEVGSTGTGLKPSWTSYSGGDTMYAIAITGPAVYIGGHFRWQNNPNTLDGDSPGAGAIGREGIAALDPANGLPLRWNPGRTKGVGVFDLLATSKGLWVGSDTDRIGNSEYHARIAFMPLSGGSSVPQLAVGTLPGDVHLQPTTSGAAPIKRSFNGTSVGTTSTVPTGGINWNGQRGATMLGNRMYYGWSNGSFITRTFNGTSYGTGTTIATSDALTTDTAFHTDLASATGMFFYSGRLYYTVSGRSSLYYRYFTPESGAVGATRFTADASGVSFSQAQGVFLANSKLYYADSSSGNLVRVDFSGGKPVSNTSAIVSGPKTDGNDWRTRGSYVFPQ
ncbi:hypothetical protein GCM10027569_73000 [Flindersiella endophytica]